MNEMKTVVKWVGEMSFVGESGSGHTVVMDSASDSGGRNLAPRPMEMVLFGLGGCSSFDVVKLLKEAGQKVKGVELHLQAQRADTQPAVFTRIQAHFVVSGSHLDEKQVLRAVQLSAEKYSSVSKMLEQSVNIHYDYQIISTDHDPTT